MTVLRPATAMVNAFNPALIEPSLTTSDILTRHHRKQYLYEAEKEYLRMLDDAVEEVQELIAEVNNLSSQLAP